MSGAAAPGGEPVHVPAGLMRVVPFPARLLATVGAEIAVAIGLLGETAGGLLNLASHHVFSAGGGGVIVEARGRAFAEALRQVRRPIGPCIAVIAGGADPSGILPSTLRPAIAAQLAATLQRVLLEEGVAVSRVEVGGASARRVSLNTAAALVVVEPVPRAAAGPPPPRGVETTVEMGALAVERAPNRLAAILGSCVGVALVDRAAHIGALAHVVMPHRPAGAGDQARYADTAVGALIDAVLRAGGSRAALGAKIAGGARIFLPAANTFRVAEDNVRVIRAALAAAGVPLLGEDVGGNAGRRISVDLATFRIAVRHLAAGDVGALPVRT